VGSRRCSWTSISIEIVVVLAAALVLPASAGAHAFLKESQPASGSTVGPSLREVRLIFDEGVKPAPGIKVLRGGGQSVVAGAPFQSAGKPNEIDIPLQKNLGSGPYAVIWSEIDRDDGHVISGAYVFTVGKGPPIPSARGAQTGGSGTSPSAVISRWLLLVGLLAGAGSVGFALLVWRPMPHRPLALTVVGALALATLGAVLNVVLISGSVHTSFGHRTLIGAGVAAVGGTLALTSLRLPQLLAPAVAIAIALLGLPTATGHATAPGVTRTLSIPADLVHLAAVAFWIGGVFQLAVVAPRALRPQLVRRFTPFAIAAVVLLGVSGVVRAFNELSAVHQLWTTSYGQSLLVKTGVLVGLLALGWLSRVRVRASVVAELALFAVVIGAVAVLTNVRPGKDYATAAARPQSGPATVEYAGQDDDLAVGLAVTPKRNAVGLRATILGFKGPVAGLDVRFGVQNRQSTASSCGAGCYGATIPLVGKPRALSVRVAGPGRNPATLHFAGPTQWPAPPGLAIVRRAERTIDGLQTLVVHSRLASDAKHEVTTVYKMAAPDRLSYRNGDGSGSVIIGHTRWDTDNGKRWVKSPQDPALQQPAPFWPPAITNPRVLRIDRVDGRPVWVVSFLDAATPAWFTAWVDRSTYRTLRLEMVATAHFMHDRDGPFDAPLSVEPPK
jgi:copper transport protein